MLIFFFFYFYLLLQLFFHSFGTSGFGQHPCFPALSVLAFKSPLLARLRLCGLDWAVELHKLVNVGHPSLY